VSSGHHWLSISRPDFPRLAHLETIFFDGGIDGSLHRSTLVFARANNAAHFAGEAPVLQAFGPAAFATKA
jgi:hypothetical protein